MAQTGGRPGGQATSQRATKNTTANSATNRTGAAARPSAAASPAGTAGTGTSMASTLGTAIGGALGTLGAWRDRASAALVQPAATPRAGTGAAATTTTGKTTAAGAATTPKRPSTGKVMLGMLAFVAGAELLLFLVQFLDVRFFKGYLELHTVASHNTPLLGGMTWFLLILMVLTLGLWIALNRLGIIQPLTPRPQTGAARGGTGTGTTTTAAAGRNRAARRLAEANATSSAKGATKGTSGAAKGGTVKAATVSAGGDSGRLSGSSDAAYQRVKAAQRSRKRRGAKR